MADLIFVIFSPQMYFLGSIFLHMKARKLWQNLTKFPKISENVPKFPKISPHDNFFSTNIIRDIRDKSELCKNDITSTLMLKLEFILLCICLRQNDYPIPIPDTNDLHIHHFVIKKKA